MRVKGPPCVLLLILGLCSCRTTWESPPDPRPIEWVEVEGGSFEMGSEAFEDDEAPVHTVVIGDLRVLRSEVTVHQYRACLDAGDCGWPGHGWDELGEDDRSQDDMPVTQVSIEDARAFCAWQDGGRLPSEAEWEYLARSRGQDRLYPWGDDEPSRDHAVHDWSLGWLYPVLSWRVCERPDGDTDQGLCDMAGSVSELVEDCYHDGYEVEDWDGVVVRAPDDGTPWTELCDGDGVVRGGSWDSGSHDELRASRRDRIEDPWDGRSSIGFRCVR